MARRRKNTRVFNGKKYYLLRVRERKSDLKEVAEHYRKQGYGARIVKGKGKWFLYVSGKKVRRGRRG